MISVFFFLLLCINQMVIITSSEISDLEEACFKLHDFNACKKYGQLVRDGSTTNDFTTLSSVCDNFKDASTFNQSLETLIQDEAAKGLELSALHIHIKTRYCSPIKSHIKAKCFKGLSDLNNRASILPEDCDIVNELPYCYSLSQDIYPEILKITDDNVADKKHPCNELLWYMTDLCDGMKTGFDNADTEAFAKKICRKRKVIAKKVYALSKINGVKPSLYDFCRKGHTSSDCIQWKVDAEKPIASKNSIRQRS